MLTRQKILLSMLRCAERPVQRTELMKWCFLLRHDSRTGGGSSFYDFVPYKFGPFSFALYQEVEKLVSMSYVLQHGDQTWSLNSDLAPSGLGVGAAVEWEVRAVVSEFGRLSIDELLDYVYQRHPEYTVNSDRRRLMIRPTTEIAIYTAGYEGASIDGFLNLLIASGIERLIDVRSNPISRRYGFHKSTLRRLTGGLDIDYRHFAELGIQSDTRRSFPSDHSREDMFDQYESRTLEDETEAVKAVSGLVVERPSVLVCMEADSARCHRSRLAKAIARRTGLEVVDLGRGDERATTADETFDRGNDLPPSFQEPSGVDLHRRIN